VNVNKPVWAVAAALAFGVIPAAHAETPATPIRFVMDWAFEGAQSIWTIAVQKGCFKAHGIDLTLNRGFGSGDSVSKVASGAYDIGVSDFATFVDFDGKHPEQKLISTLIISDLSPTSVESLKKNNITKPQDLVGKRIADPVGEASRVLFPAFAKANGIDPASVTWISVAPNLRQTTLVRGEADAAAGHMFTVLTGLRALGVPDADVTVMKYADWGVNLYGNAVITKPAWAAAHADAMKAFVGCAVEGVQASIADPQAAVASLKPFEPLVDEKIEMASLAFSTNDAILTENVKKNGLSQVDPARMDRVLTQISDAIGIAKPAMADVYTAAYLPPPAAMKIHTETSIKP
jgi:NitT/TauT family transport system substrate-binding protein